MEPHKLRDSFNCAIEGIVYVLRTQRNMRVHFFAAAVVIVASFVCNIPRVDLLLVCIAVFFVLFAEMVNTAAELTIDLISDTYHPLARLVKDIGAGAVLMAAINAIVVGYLVFAHQIERRVLAGSETVRALPLYMTFLALLLVLVISVLMKIILHRGTPMQGGMPSVHSAVAFAAAMVVTLIIPSSPLVIMIVFLLALMVVQARVAAGIHSYTEVVLGALIGSILTLLLYQLYRAVIGGG